jgi:transposase InsO family protein
MDRVSAQSVIGGGAMRVGGVARSTYYYEPVVASEENLKLMRVIDELYLKRPFYGSPRMTDWLSELGWMINEKRVARLMRVDGIAGERAGTTHLSASSRASGLPVFTAGSGSREA